MNTEPVRLSHPAACPHCGGKTVNQVQPDYHLRPAQLNDDGTIIVGDVVDGSDFPGPCLLHCHTCGSTYVQPGDVTEVYIRALRLDYPTAVQAGDPGFIGMGVAWTAVPTAPTWSAPHAVTARG